MKKTVWAAVVAAVLLAFALGRRTAPIVESAGGRQTNNLIRAGFTVTDPEGFPVDHFDESP